MKCLTYLPLIMLVLLSITGCDPDRVYDDSQDIPDHIWEKDFVPAYEVEVKDTTLLYNVYVNVRHTDFYPFSNLWVMIYTTFPDGHSINKRVELTLSDKKGKWHSDCLGDICDAQILIQDKAFFSQQGTYTFKLEQIMRTEKLPAIMGVGLRLEKAGSRDAASQE